MKLEIIIAFVLIYYLRKPPQGIEISISKKKILNMVLVFLIVAFIVGEFNLINDVYIKAIGFFMIGYSVYLVLYLPEFHHRRNLVYALSPLVIISLSEDIVAYARPDLMEKYGGYFDTAAFFAVIWAFAMWYISKKQKKSLEIERKKAHEKEKEHQITQQLKAELEVRVKERTSELTQQKEALEKTLRELKATQTQLIHAEKMASLGELTAGIAHEIQNPLNFVNNFSEVTNELMVEMKEELEKGNISEAMSLITDIEQNMEKINEHGKRAGSIVRGMLLHSRSSSGKMERVNVNNLADEYLRLSYHGLRAKDRTFNAKFKMDLDPDLPEIMAIPQDIGRVLLNLISNAFYAVNEKASLIKAADFGENYIPYVEVKTGLTDSHIKVLIIDNGPGIPEAIKEKIFQPFFTTKPTGEGTGLGLSLSYDILKAHGGEIQINSIENKGTTISVFLPLGKNQDSKALK
jgi:two-component system, NtrC family, sensor kinase